MNVFIANIGNRDIALNVGDDANPWYVYFDKGEDGKYVRQFLSLPDDAGARAMAEHVRQNIGRYADLLKFPLLIPPLDYALSQVDSLDLVLLFATDQSKSVKAHWPWDTIESAYILGERLPLNANFQNKISRIEIIPVADPSSHDLAYNFIGEVLNQYVPLSQVKRLFATISGGIPALNSAFRAQAIDMYGALATLIQADEPSSQERASGVESPLNIVDTWPFRKTAILRVVHTLLERYDYSGVQQVLAREKVSCPQIDAFLQHANARFNLNFEGAATALQHFGSGKPAQWKISTTDPWRRQRLAELAWTAQVLFERRDFVGFVTRIASLCETTRRQLVWLVVGLKIEEGHLSQSKVGRCSLNLCGFLKGKNLKEVSNGIWKVDRALFNAIIRWGEQQGQNTAQATAVKAVRGLIAQLGKLEKFRNEAVHLIKGTSKSDVEQAFPQFEQRFPSFRDDLIKAMETVERVMTKPTHFVEPEQIYKDINKEILEELEKV